MSQCHVYSVDSTKFSWCVVPVVDGAFTLGQALSKEAKEHVNITLDYNQILTEFEYVPCTRLYSLTFGDSYMFVIMGRNIIEEITLINAESLEKQNFMYHSGSDVEINSYNNYDKNDNKFYQQKPVSSLTIRDEQLVQKIMTIPQELLDNIRVKLVNGQIADKDGVLYGVIKN